MKGLSQMEASKCSDIGSLSFWTFDGVIKHQSSKVCCLILNFDDVVEWAV